MLMTLENGVSREVEEVVEMRMLLDQNDTIPGW